MSPQLRAYGLLVAVLSLFALSMVAAGELAARILPQLARFP